MIAYKCKDLAYYGFFFMLVFSFIIIIIINVIITTIISTILSFCARCFYYNVFLMLIKCYANNYFCI